MRISISLLVLILALCSIRLAWSADSSLADAIQQVSTGNNEARLAALERIAVIGPQARSALPVLLAALKDHSLQTRPAILKAIRSMGAETLPELRTALRDANIDVRIGTAEAIGFLGQNASTAIPVLIDVLEKDKPLVRYAAARALYHLAPYSRSAIPALTSALGQDSVLIPAAAADALGAFGADAKPSVPALLTASRAPASDVSVAAVRALAAIAPEAPEVATRLTEGLSDPVLQEVSVRALARCGVAAEPAIPQIAGLLQSNAPAIRCVAAQTLGALGPRAASALPQLKQTLNDSFPFVLEAAVNAMIRVGPDAVPPLLQMVSSQNFTAAIVAENALSKIVHEYPDAFAGGLKSNTSGVKLAALRLLAKSPPIPSNAAAGMVALLADPSQDVRNATKSILAQTSGDTLPRLIEALSDPNEMLVLAVLDTLRQAGPRARDSADALKALVSASGSLKVRCAAAEALGGLGLETTGIVVPLTEMLADTAEPVRISAARTLGRIGWTGTATRTALLEMLRDPQSEVQIAAMEALGRTTSNETEIINALKPGINDNKSHVRAAAIKAIGSIKSKAALPCLLQASRDQDSPVRQAAAPGLARFAGEPEADTAITSMLNDMDAWVKKTMLLSLGNAGRLTPGMESSLAGFLASTNAEQALAAVEALRKLGPAGYGVLGDALGSKELRVCRAAAAALKQCGPEARLALPGAIRSLSAGAITNYHALEFIKSMGPAIEPCLDDAIKAMGNPKVGDEARHTLVQVIGPLGSKGKAAAPILMQFVQQERSSMRRQEAAVAFLKVSPDLVMAAKQLLAIPGSQDVVARAIRDCGCGKALIPVLIEYLRSAQNVGREDILQAIVAQGEDGAKALAPLLDNADAPVRLDALKGLRLLGPKAACVASDVFTCMKRYQDHDAVSALGAIGPTAMPDLLRVCKNESHPIRTRIAAIISRYKAVPTELVPPLVEDLKTSTEPMRGITVALLGRSGSAAASAVPVLMTLIRNDDPEFREAVKVALRQIGDARPDDVKTLLPYLSDNDWMVRSCAALALSNIAKQDAAEILALNEIAAATVCNRFVAAQNVYCQTDWNGDGVMEYAQRMRGNDSLLERKAGTADLGLIDRNIAEAEGQPGPGVAFSGYRFTILSSQGDSAPGGAMSYIVDGHMTKGFAMLAYPVEYGRTGRNTFLANRSGIIKRKDLGAETLRLVTDTTSYNPDPSWIDTALISEPSKNLNRRTPQTETNND